MKWVIYRIHYGIDFLEESVNSVLDWADHVMICYSEQPWVKDQVVECKGVLHGLKNPEKVHKFLESKFAHNDKVSYWRREFDTPKNQFRLIYEEALEKRGIVPEACLFMEPDMVFEKSQPFRMHDELKHRDLEHISSIQVELWKTAEWRIPERDRVGPTMWNTSKNNSFQTHFGTTSVDGNINKVNGFASYNFGFCFNPETMLYKHLTALSFSAKIGDSIPSEEWYEDKWLNWTPETTDLEISRNYKGLIPKAVPYKLEKIIKGQLKYE